MNDSTYHVNMRLMMTSDLEVGNCLKLGDGLAPIHFNIALEYVIRQLSVEHKSTTFHKSPQLIEYADDINTMGRTKGAVSAVYEGLKESCRSMAQHHI